MSSPDSKAAPPRTRLKGNLGVLALLFTVMAFNAPLGTVVATIPVPIGFGNGAGAPVLFLVGATLMAFLAVGFIKMYPFMTNSGGFYVYITAGLGKVVGLGASFLAQASYFILLMGGSAFSGYSMNTLVLSFGGPDIPWWVFTIGLLVVVGVLGYRRLDLSAHVLTVVLLTELLVILVYNLGVMLQGGAAGLDIASSLDPSTIFGGSLGIALLIGVSAMGGFEATVIFREEVRDPERTIPRATFIFILITGVMFCITSWSMIQAVGSSAAQSVYSVDPAGAVLGTVETYFGRVGHDLVTVLVNTSALAATLAAQNIAARYAFNLGNDRILPKFLSRVHEKHGSPYLASLAVTFAAVVAIIPFIILNADPTFLFVQLLSTYSYSFLVMLVITCVAVAVFLIRRKPEGTNVWHRIVAPTLAFVGIGTTVVFATANLDVLFGGTGPVVVALLSALYGLLVLGMIVALILKRRKPEIYALIGRQ